LIVAQERQLGIEWKQVRGFVIHRRKFVQGVEDGFSIVEAGIC